MKKLTQFLCSASAIKISSIFKMSFVIGSQMLWLSGPAVLTPLSGAFGGVLGSFCIFFARMAIHFLLFRSISLSFLAFCIPGFFASLYWATRSSVIRVCVPLLCIALFILHPIGSQACVYSLYWLIPVVLFCIPGKSLFLEALGSTFVAHAVGSVIWLYTVPMTAAMWLGLIPLVAIERLLFAVCMVIVYKVIVWAHNFITDLGYNNVKTSGVYYGRKSAVGN